MYEKPRNGKSFNQKFVRIIAWKKENLGNWPSAGANCTSEEYRLYVWMRRWRNEYLKGEMPKIQIVILEGERFVWEPQKEYWKKTLNDLQYYKLKYGDFYQHDRPNMPKRDQLITNRISDLRCSPPQDEWFIKELEAVGFEFGARLNSIKLSEDDLDTVVKLRKCGVGWRELGDLFDCSVSTIRYSLKKYPELYKKTLR